MAETIFVCANCGNEFSKWAGQCSACGEWNTLKEAPKIKTLNSKIGNRAQASSAPTIKNLGSLKAENNRNSNIFSTEIGEFDRVLGKGIVQGSVILFGGEPGIGKSTLLTQLVGKVGGLYVAGEESAEQINLRVKRLGVRAEGIDVLETNSIEEIEGYLDRTQNVYKMAIIDSIQTMLPAAADALAGKAGVGSINGIKEATYQLVRLAKQKNIAIFIVGHVTKEGEIAGPKMLEHMVDTVLYFEGDRNSDFRILRVDKNRFGPTDEVGVFKMEEKGLREIKSEEINLVSAKQNSVGSAITIVMEGTRPMMVEVQALVTESFAPMPTRVFSGIDNNRGRLLVAVAQKVLGMPMYKYDVYVSVTGGIRIEDTGSDMAVIAAMYSSFKEKPAQTPPASGHLPLTGEAKKGPVWIGEVSLLGEVKKVRGMEKREKEARGMGREVVKMGSIRELK